MSEPTNAPTSVYRYYDENGILLYVGITSRGIARNREHNTSKAWWQYVAAQEVEHFSTRRGAEARERDLIASRRPPFNSMHNPESGSLRAAYAKMRATSSALGISPRDAVAPSGRVQLSLLPVIDPMSVTLSMSSNDAPQDLDVSDQSKIIIISGGRKAKLRDARWAAGSLRLTISTRNANACIGAYAKLRKPSTRGEMPTIKLIELLYEGS